MKAMLSLVLFAVFAPVVVTKREGHWPANQLISEDPLTLNMAAVTLSNWTYPLMFDSELRFTLKRPSDGCLDKTFNNIVQYHFENGITNCTYQVIWQVDYIYLQDGARYSTTSDVKLVYHTDVVEMYFSDGTNSSATPLCPYHPKNHTVDGADGIYTLNFTVIMVKQDLPCNESIIVFDKNVQLTDPNPDLRKHHVLLTIVFIVVGVVVVACLAALAFYCFRRCRGVGCVAKPEGNVQPIRPLNPYTGVDSGAGSALSAVQTKTIEGGDISAV